MTETKEINAVITKIDGFKVKAMNLADNEILELQKSKFGDITKQEIKENTKYNMTVVIKDGTYWLNSAREDVDKKIPEVEQKNDKFDNADSKFVKLVASTNAMENKNLLIMAQACQHDAAALIKDKTDQNDYGSVEEFAADVIEMRDILLKDLVEKYYK